MEIGMAPQGHGAFEAAQFQRIDDLAGCQALPANPSLHPASSSRLTTTAGTPAFFSHRPRFVIRCSRQTQPADPSPRQREAQ